VLLWVLVSFTLALRMTRPHGLCVGLRLPTADQARTVDLARELERLAPEERALARDFGPLRLATFIGGRLAARAALAELSVTCDAILPDERGAPLFPPGTRGSISHKDQLAVALVSQADEWTRGVDVELLSGPRVDVSSRVLSAAEARVLANEPDDVRASEVLFRFSAKEALYKALDPHVRRFVAFHEVSVLRDADGKAYFELDLARGEGPFKTELDCWSWQDMLLVTARVRRA
jgi:enterobactin synthetase component D